MALIKNEQKPQNDDLQAITTLLTLVLEKSSKIDDLEKTIKAIDFKPQTTVSLNRELLSNEIAEKLKFQGVRYNEPKSFIQKYKDDWEKNTIILVLSMVLALSVFGNYKLSKEINDRIAVYDDSKNLVYSTSKTGNYKKAIQELLNYRDIKTQENQETKSKKSKK